MEIQAFAEIDAGNANASGKSAVLMKVLNRGDGGDGVFVPALAL
jgi:hypothetical protein